MLLTILCSILVVLFTILAIKFYYQRIHRFHVCLAHIPGPHPLPFFGNALEFGSSTEILDVLLKFQFQYGSTYKLSMGPHRFMLVSANTKFLEFLLSSQNILDKSRDYTYLRNWLKTGLLTAGGKKWKPRRRLIAPTFHIQILEQFVEVFDSTGKILIEKLKNEVGKESTNIYPYITLYALDNICESSMGTSVNAQKHSNSEYVHSVKEMCRIIIERSFSAFKMHDIIYRFTKDYYKEKRAIDILHNYTDTVIQSRKRKLCNYEKKADENEETGIKKRLAFLDLLLQIKVDGKPLTDEDLQEEVATFLFAGHDTVSSAISFTLFCLANHQNVQQKVIEELKTIFADKQKCSVTHRDLLDMKYLELVIKESLRLYPPVPFYAREISEDVVYEGKILPRGLSVTIFAYGIHKDPKLFPEPEKFDPERFRLDNCIGRSPYAFIPFSLGPRNCIGQKFAMLEMKATISKILLNFELHPAVPEYHLKLAAETVLKSANGIKIQLKKRSL